MRVKRAFRTWLLISIQWFLDAFVGNASSSSPRRSNPCMAVETDTQINQMRRAAFLGCSIHSLKLAETEDQLMLPRKLMPKRRCESTEKKRKARLPPFHPPCAGRSSKGKRAGASRSIPPRRELAEDQEHASYASLGLTPETIESS